jgi:parallel beta-helix repeat protein
MKKYPLMEKCLVVGIIFLFVGAGIIPSALSEQTHGKKIITVDNEPGDADYTSIKEAINHSSPGDTIEVFSGTYNESNITIKTSNLILIGIPHEVGIGNDTEKPVIEISSFAIDVFYVIANNVSISGFMINGSEGGYLYNVIRLWYADHCTIFNNDIFLRGGTFFSVLRILYANYTMIQNTTVNGGDCLLWLHESHDCWILNNSFLNCTGQDGLSLQGSNFTIIKNIICNCYYDGIFVTGGRNIVIDNNELRNNVEGIWLRGTRSFTIKVTRNNFIRNHENAVFMGTGIRFSDLVFSNNYWNRPHILPKPIFGHGFLLLFLSPEGIPIGLPIPWICFDWHPAQKPNAI